MAGIAGNASLNRFRLYISCSVFLSESSKPPFEALFTARKELGTVFSPYNIFADLFFRPAIISFLTILDYSSARVRTNFTGLWSE